MKTTMIGGVLLLLIALGVPALGEEPTPVPSCGDCHDEQAKAFLTNPHGVGVGQAPSPVTPEAGQSNAEQGAEQAGAPVIPNAVCERCHGDGKAHIEGGGDKALIYKPAGVAGADKTCMSCHDLNNDRISRHAGFHANRAAVNCLTCHSIHTAKANPLLTKPQLALCETCHATQVASFRNKPYAHRLGRGGMECSSCHEPHGRPGRESLRKTTTGELPCVNCHTEKRGPFVFQHGSFAIADCMTCHEPHGASNPKRLLRSRVAQLCLECHSTISSATLGSQPPSFHNLSLPRYQNCTTCHVAVHGSNRDPALMK